MKVILLHAILSSIVSIVLSLPQVKNPIPATIRRKLEGNGSTTNDAMFLQQLPSACPLMDGFFAGGSFLDKSSEPLSWQMCASFCANTLNCDYWVRKPNGECGLYQGEQDPAADVLQYTGYISGTASCLGEYVYGDRGSKSCGASLVPITLEECRSAGVELGLIPWIGVKEGTTFNQVINPSGCFRYKTKIFFNSNEGGGGHPDVDPICKKGSFTRVSTTEMCRKFHVSSRDSATKIAPGHWDPESCALKLEKKRKCSNEWFGVSKSGVCWCVEAGDDCTLRRTHPDMYGLYKDTMVSMHEFKKVEADLRTLEAEIKEMKAVLDYAQSRVR